MKASKVDPNRCKCKNPSYSSFTTSDGILMVNASCCNKSLPLTVRNLAYSAYYSGLEEGRKALQLKLRDLLGVVEK